MIRTASDRSSRLLAVVVWFVAEKESEKINTRKYDSGEWTHRGRSVCLTSTGRGRAFDPCVGKSRMGTQAEELEGTWESGVSLYCL